MSKECQQAGSFMWFAIFQSKMCQKFQFLERCHWTEMQKASDTVRLYIVQWSCKCLYKSKNCKKKHMQVVQLVLQWAIKSKKVNQTAATVIGLSAAQIFSSTFVRFTRDFRWRWFSSFWMTKFPFLVGLVFTTHWKVFQNHTDPINLILSESVEYWFKPNSNEIQYLENATNSWNPLVTN